MAISVASISAEQAAKVLSLEEGHFADVKAIEIAPSKLAQTLSAFANADDGELYIGIAEQHRQAESMEKKGLIEKVPETARCARRPAEACVPYAIGVCPGPW